MATITLESNRLFPIFVFDLVLDEKKTELEVTFVVLGKDHF